MIGYCKRCKTKFIQKFNGQKHKCLDLMRARERREIKKKIKQEVVANTPASDAERSRNYRLANKYGITQGKYNAMYAEQLGRCAICGKNEPKLFVDHNHSTGKVRGLLCSNCNTAIGMLNDDLHLMTLAYSYVKSDGVRYTTL